jgi:hypothetical protein
MGICLHWHAELVCCHTMRDALPEMDVMFVKNKEESNGQLLIEKKLVYFKLGTLYIDIFIRFDMLE